MMNRYRWMLSLLTLAALLLSAVQPVVAQEPIEQSGLRPDAPEYGIRGPHWVGYRPIVIGEGTDQQLDADLWYPALNPEGATEEITYEFTPKIPDLRSDVPSVAYGHALLDAPIDDSMGPYPLVVFSHGFALNPEWYSTLTEHYASHGFIVLAPEHVDGEWMESALASSIDRPRDIKQTLDYAEEVTAPGGDLAGQIDMENVAVVGHSYGGYTTLAIAGAQYDMEAFTERCASLPEDDPNMFLCMPLVGKEEFLAERAGLDEVPEGLWPSFGDPRVTAIVPIAGNAYLFDKAGLSKITIPMMAIGATADTVLPYDWASKPSYDYASSARKALVAFAGAEHMFVSTPCESMPWLVNLPFSDMLCLDPVWDKDRALDLAHHFSTAFLLAELKADTDAAAALAPDSVDFPGIEYETTGFEEDMDAVMEAIWSEYTASIGEGDIERWVEVWVEDGIQLPPGEAAVVGKDNILARNSAVFEPFDVSMSITNEEVIAEGNWAYARGVYEATLTPKAGGEDIQVDGKYVTILQKQPDGTWKIYRDIFNSNVPPE